MKLFPSTSRIAAGSISPRSGASRLPRRSFQYANSLRVVAVFTGRVLSHLGSCPRRPCLRSGHRRADRRVVTDWEQKACRLPIRTARAAVSVKARPRLAARRGKPRVRPDHDLKPGRQEDVTKGGPKALPCFLPRLAPPRRSGAVPVLAFLRGLHHGRIGVDIFTEESVEPLRAIAIGPTPSVARRSRTTLSSSAFGVSRWSRSTISRGV